MEIDPIATAEVLRLAYPMQVIETETTFATIPTCRLRILLNNPLLKERPTYVSYPAWLMEERLANEDFPRVLVTVRPSVSQIGRSSPGLVFIFPPRVSDSIICHLAKRCEDRDPRRSWDPMNDPLLSLDLDILINPNKKVEMSVTVMLPDPGTKDGMKLIRLYVSLHTFYPDTRNGDLCERSLTLLNFLQSHIVKSMELRRTLNSALSFVLYVKYNLEVKF